LAAIFTPAANLVMKVALGGLAAGALVLIGFVYGVPWMDYNTQVRLIPPQPVPFSHKHHVGGLGLDCRYCHDKVEVSATASMPPTYTCMTCHSQIWTNAKVLEPVRESLATGEPLRWRKVNDLPDYVFFNHSIHVAKGVACTTCHGPVNEMPLMWKSQSLYMSWCLQCHRDPAPRIRPREFVFDPTWKPTPDTPSGQQLVKAYHIKQAGLDDCSVCHR
jgi:hypothetical protein